MTISTKDLVGRTFPKLTLCDTPKVGLVCERMNVIQRIVVQYC